MSNNPILRIAVALLANFMLLAFVLPALISAKSTLFVLLGFGNYSSDLYIYSSRSQVAV